MIFYADDIALLIGATRPPTAFSKIENNLEKLISWAAKYGLKFSPSKSSLMSLEGGLKPGYRVRFGTQANAMEIVAINSVKYLVITLVTSCDYFDYLVIIIIIIVVIIIVIDIKVNVINLHNYYIL